MATPAPDPSRANPRIPRSMARAVSAALAKDPSQRPSSALELVRVLSGSLRTDELAGRATLLYLGLVLLWGASYWAVTFTVDAGAEAQEAALHALATCNVVYFLALSLLLLLAEARREAEPERLWPLCLLAFPITPVWLWLVVKARRSRRRGEPDGEGSQDGLLHSSAAG